MTRYAFNHLPFAQQPVAVRETGTFLARRWEEADGGNRYHLPGDFFVEPYYDTHANEVVRLRSFRGAAPLEDYAVSVRLPDDWR